MVLLSGFCVLMCSGYVRLALIRPWQDHPESLHQTGMCSSQWTEITLHLFIAALSFPLGLDDRHEPFVHPVQLPEHPMPFPGTSPCHGLVSLTEYLRTGGEVSCR